MRSKEAIEAKIKELGLLIQKGEPEEFRITDNGSLDALLWVMEREHIGLPNRP